MNVVDIPHIWNNVLNKIQVEFPGSVIAGGALRDLFNHKPIKDVDIFIPTSEPTEAFDIIERMFPDVILDSSNVYGVGGDEEGRDLHAVYKLIHPLWEFDLILCNPESTDVHKFDIGLCQITYNGKSIQTTEAYRVGVECKVLQVVNITRSDRNVKRLDRLHQKYPEFRIEEYQDDTPF